VDNETDLAILEQVGLTQLQVEDMYRYLAIANYEDRFVIPTTHREYASSTFDAFSERGGCGFSFGNGCSNTPDLFNSKKSTERHHSNPIKPDSTL
jgi:nitrate reductase beta subunit